MRIKRFNDYKLLLEAEGDEETDNELEGGSEEEAPEETPNDFTDEYLQDPTYYINQALNVVKNKVVSLFDEPKPKANDRTVEVDQSSYHAQGMQLLDIKYTDMPLNKSLIIKFEGDDYLYHLLITIKIDQGKIELEKDGDENLTEIDNCGVKFKKYDKENNLVGQVARKKVLLDDIDQDFIDTLNADLDEKFSVQSDEFEIEYKEDED
jgi:hypothetical protein